MSKSVLAIRHMFSGNPFNIETVFDAHDFNTSLIEGFSTDISSIDPLEPDIVLVMGGAMGVYEADLYPYLHDEIALLKARIAADRPTLGVCLGSQLMAASQGKRVYKGENGKEFGFFPINLTEAGKETPLRHLSADLTRVLHMHGDTFELPDNATLLASTDLYKNQAYRIGQNCFGVQFHPEVEYVGFENLLVEDNGRIDVAAFRAEGQKYLPTMEKQTTLFVNDLIKIWDKA